MDRLTFITGNPDKAAQLAKYLGLKVDHQKLDLTEIQSLKLEDVVAEKAIQAYKKIQAPVLVDDTALIIEDMGKLPGPFVKFFLSEIGLSNLCRMIGNNREAIAQVAIAYFDGERLEICLGQVLGVIADTPRGEGGFGWDAIFVPKGHKLTRAEMGVKDYDLTSPRRIALDKFKALTF